MMLMTYKMNHNQNLHLRQEGAALFVALIFLTMLTIVGVSAVRSGAFQEKIAGNNHQQNMAFGASEAAIGALYAWSKQGDTILQDARLNGSVSAFVTDAGLKSTAATKFDSMGVTETNVVVTRGGCQPRSCEGFSVGSKRCQFYDVTATSNVAGFQETILWKGFEVSARCY